MKQGIMEKYLAGQYCHCQVWSLEDGWVVGYINNEEATRVQVIHRLHDCKVLIIDVTKSSNINDQRITICETLSVEEADALILAASFRADYNR